jgi:hypothetical protein
MDPKYIPLFLIIGGIIWYGAVRWEYPPYSRTVEHPDLGLSLTVPAWWTYRYSERFNVLTLSTRSWSDQGNSDPITLSVSALPENDELREEGFSHKVKVVETEFLGVRTLKKESSMQTTSLSGSVVLGHTDVHWLVLADKPFMMSLKIEDGTEDAPEPDKLLKSLHFQLRD